MPSHHHKKPYKKALPVEPRDPSTEDAAELQHLLTDNQIVSALITGVITDMEIFKRSTSQESVSSIMRLSMQLGVLNDRKTRNLQKIQGILAKTSK